MTKNLVNKKDTNRIQNDEIIMKQYFKMGSVTYGMLFSLFGIVLVTIEPFKTCNKCENLVKIFIESFFIFMYTISIVWIVVMFVLITKAKREEKIAIKHPTGLNRRLSVPFVRSSRKNFLKKKSQSILKRFNFLNWREKQTQDAEETDEATQQDLEFSYSLAKAEQEQSISNYIVSTHDLSTFHFTYDYENGTGELYMRVGTAIFSLCSLIDRCLSLIQMIETYMNNHEAILECKITFIVSLLAKTTSFLFIFLQTFFIFKYANIIINYGKNWAVVGLMHIMCTNLCVFFRTIVHETVAEIRDHNLHHSPNHYTKNGHHLKSKDESLLSLSILHKQNATSTKLNYLNHSIANKSHTTLSSKMNLFNMKQLGCINTLSFTPISVNVQDAKDKLAPYLFPCIIEYSLMCMTIFYVLWSTVKQASFKPHNNMITILNTHDTNEIDIDDKSNHKSHMYEKNSAARKHHIKSNSLSNEHNFAIKINETNEVIDTKELSAYLLKSEYKKRHVHQFQIDCAKSTTGLFCGLCLILLSIISFINYFIYKDKKMSVSILISDITELTLILISFFIVLAIFFQLNIHYKFEYKKIFKFDYNIFLLILGLTGIYLFGFYSIIAILNNGIESHVEALSLAIQIISLFESTLQSIFIIEGLNMFTRNKNIKKIKPARSLITLLILIDVSLWLCETLSVKKYDMFKIQLDYYGIVFWSLVTTVSCPIAIFFRFHSSVCLSDIWKDIYE